MTASRAAADPPVWMSPARRRGLSYPAVYHRSEYCAARRDREPRRLTERAARKIARACRSCQHARWLLRPGA